MKRCKLLLPIILILAFGLLIGCEDDATTGPVDPTTISGWLSLGWSEYESGDYQDAADAFNDGLNLADSQYWDAYGDWLYGTQTGDQQLIDEAVARMDEAVDYIVKTATGLGWAAIELDDLNGGNNVFDIVYGINSEYGDALAGQSIVLQILEEYTQSNKKAGELLAVDDDWVFSHKDVDYLDIRLVRAENYFLLADFEASLQEALSLNEIVGNTVLSEADFNLATIEGRTALMNLIDALDDII